MKPANPPASLPHGEFLVYESEDGRVKLEVRLKDETVWLTQADMARLFQCSTDNVSLHLKNIYDEGELRPTSTPEDFSVVRKTKPQEGGETMKLTTGDTRLLDELCQLQAYAGKVFSLSPFPLTC